MALIIDTSTLKQGSATVRGSNTGESIHLDSSRNHWLYNGLDCCVTREVWDETRLQLNSLDLGVYNFERACNAPALEMMLRGSLVDMDERDRAVRQLEKDEERVRYVLGRLVEACTGTFPPPTFARSKKQLAEFFHGTLKLPEQWVSEKGVRKLSFNRESLETLGSYFRAQPIVGAILALRDIGKTLSVLRKGVDADYRIRTSYNVGATETGRWSASKNAFGTGDNLQNWTQDIRRIIVADPGRKFCNLDLEQAESRVVGLLCGLLCNDFSYLDACESGDLHTLTAKMIWPSQVQDKPSAEAKFYRDFSYRDMSKRGGHGSNYYGKPFTIAKHLKVETKLIQDFQDKYFSVFPGIPKWHQAVARELQLKGILTTPFGRTRQFWGRRFDDSTLREAIAQVPQSFVGDLLNLIVWRMWNDARRLDVWLQIQVHDSILFSYPEHLESEVLAWATNLANISLVFGDRVFSIPTECKVGWTWGNFNDDPKRGRLLPDGLKKIKGVDTRVRTNNPTLSFLDRRF